MASDRSRSSDQKDEKNGATQGEDEEPYFEPPGPDQVRQLSAIMEKSRQQVKKNLRTPYFAPGRSHSDPDPNSAGPPLRSQEQLLREKNEYEKHTENIEGGVFSTEGGIFGRDIGRYPDTSYLKQQVDAFCADWALSYMRSRSGINRDSFPEVFAEAQELLDEVNAANGLGSLGSGTGSEEGSDPQVERDQLLEAVMEMQQKLDAMKDLNRVTVILLVLFSFFAAMIF